MEFNPLVSIVIPLYNGANYVEEALKCAVNQTYKNVEIIVVNDGSRDDGAGRKVCEKYFDKISYYEKENGGCSSALNYGIRKAKGEYISWLSHDDLYYPKKIENQIELYREKKLDAKKVIISSNAEVIDENGNKQFYPNSKKRGLCDNKKAYKHLLFNKCFNGCGLLIPKNLFFEIGFFNESMRFVLDWELWLRFTLNGAWVYLDNRILVGNRRHQAQVTVKQSELYPKEVLETLNSQIELAKQNKDDFYIKQLYYFATATGRGDIKELKKYLKENKIKLNCFTKANISFKTKFRNLLKNIYHKLICKKW